MKQLAAGLSFICFYFLLPTGAQASSLVSYHDSQTVAGVLSKPASCFVIRSPECSKRILIGDAHGASVPLPFLKPGDFTFAASLIAISSALEDSIAFSDRKHVLRTGLSPPHLV